MAKIRKNAALEYHRNGRPGKIEVVPTKPTSSQTDLSLAYSPGVAEPCLAIQDNPEDAYKYTAKGNLVAVITNGTAVLGLGDIGPLASKPVMEGKGLLFKIFADIDVFDIELDTNDVDEFVRTVKIMAPTFGGINLEDIKAPEAFEIEERLKAELDIPVMHDDQHGTAIISSAALLNALEITGKKIDDIQIVVSGAGAAAQSCVRLMLKLGVQKKNVVMFDSKGAITADRDNLDRRKKFFAVDRQCENLGEAMKNADVFLGLSKGGLVDKEMIKSMAKDPIVFALANPDPEISYKDATDTRDDIIMATGRSDHPNQVNNVLGFPYIFRGAMDVKAKCINDEMKLAAVYAIAELAKETVPEEVNQAYEGEKNMSFGKDFIIPKPMDPRLIYQISIAVAKAAIESGVAREVITDWEGYKKTLLGRLGHDNKLIRQIGERACKDPKRVVFAEADNYKILKAAEAAVDEGIAFPILLGDEKRILERIETNNLDLGDFEIINPKAENQRSKRIEFGKLFFELRQRKGLTEFEAIKQMRDRNHFGSMLVNSGYADALISGITRNYGEVIRPALQIIGLSSNAKLVSGMHIIQTHKGPFFFADTTVNRNPSVQELVDITVMVAEAVKKLKIVPHIALLSYSNFGSTKGINSRKIREVVEILHKDYPNLSVDGELQANFAINKELQNEIFPFSKLNNKKVNTLIFPNLTSGNISYKLMQEMAGFETVGPILLGMKKSVHVLQMGSSVREIVNMVRIAVLDAQSKKK